MQIYLRNQFLFETTNPETCREGIHTPLLETEFRRLPEVGKNGQRLLASTDLHCNRGKKIFNNWVHCVKKKK